MGSTSLFTIILLPIAFALQTDSVDNHLVGESIFIRSDSGATRLQAESHPNQLNTRTHWLVSDLIKFSLVIIIILITAGQLAGPRSAVPKARIQTGVLASAVPLACVFADAHGHHKLIDWRCFLVFHTAFRIVAGLVLFYIAHILCIAVFVAVTRITRSDLIQMESCGGRTAALWVLAFIFVASQGLGCALVLRTNKESFLSIRTFGMLVTAVGLGGFIIGLLHWLRCRILAVQSHARDTASPVTTPQFRISETRSLRGVRRDSESGSPTDSKNSHSSRRSTRFAANARLSDNGIDQQYSQISNRLFNLSLLFTILTLFIVALSAWAGSRVFRSNRRYSKVINDENNSYNALADLTYYLSIFVLFGLVYYAWTPLHLPQICALWCDKSTHNTHHSSDHADHKSDSRYRRNSPGRRESHGVSSEPTTQRGNARTRGFAGTRSSLTGNSGTHVAKHKVETLRTNYMRTLLLTPLHNHWTHGTQINRIRRYVERESMKILNKCT